MADPAAADDITFSEQVVVYQVPQKTRRFSNFE
jgi:hypothetical protein